MKKADAAPRAALCGGAVLFAVFAAALLSAPTHAAGRLSFDDVVRRAAALPRLRSLLISVDGTLVEEHYFHGARAASPANLKSASKSVIATLVGIALDRGHLGGIRDTIDRYFPEYLADITDAAKRRITLEDLLTMRSGLETTSNRNYGRWVQSQNWVRHVLLGPLVDEPGGRMIYSTGSSHLLSAILTKATGMSTLEFARRYLAKPLGISLGPWVQDPQGIYFGGNEMHLRPRDMLRIGELYLNCGELDGQRVLSEQWVHEATIPRTQSRFSGRSYGYGWWIRTLAGHRVFYAWGYGGQFIFVVPDLLTVVVATSLPDPARERREHLDAIYDLVEYEVIPAVANQNIAN